MARNPLNTPFDTIEATEVLRAYSRECCTHLQYVFPNSKHLDLDLFGVEALHVEFEPQSVVVVSKYEPTSHGRIELVVGIAGDHQLFGRHQLEHPLTYLSIVHTSIHVEVEHVKVRFEVKIRNSINWNVHYY